MSAKTSRNHSRINPLPLLAGLLATRLSVPALLGQSVPFPTYVPGPQPDGSYVVSDGNIITPAGTQVNLGIRVRAKAMAPECHWQSHRRCPYDGYIGGQWQRSRRGIQHPDRRRPAELQHVRQYGLERQPRRHYLYAGW